jgi:hypothetical protein
MYKYVPNKLMTYVWSNIMGAEVAFGKMHIWLLLAAGRAPAHKRVVQLRQTRGLYGVHAFVAALNRELIQQPAALGLD